MQISTCMASTDAVHVDPELSPGLPGGRITRPRTCGRPLVLQQACQTPEIMETFPCHSGPGQGRLCSAVLAVSPYPDSVDVGPEIIGHLLLAPAGIEQLLDLIDHVG